MQRTKTIITFNVVLQHIYHISKQRSEHDTRKRRVSCFVYIDSIHDPKNTKFFDTRYIYDNFKSGIKHSCTILLI